ncbi:PhoX family protein [Seonamhaeicola marinus]|uniref:Phosphatase n=1 Tax=Seonamhaeicola marinus TaxID=1912246 RepID=A0A5D0HJP5_9FLAO|nr:phosphatase [Seonamhaeicola marinus]TYA71541.1 phosphatase [Seonamhaeicola marinus]
MKKLLNPIYVLMLLASVAFTSCDIEDGTDGRDGVDGIDGVDGTDGEDFMPPTLEPLTSSVVSADKVFIKGTDFSSVNVEMLMTSQDILPSDPSFVYGSYMDGAALYPYGDGTYAFINNLERDFSIARIRLNANLQPLEGDYIVNAFATGFTAQCSASSITEEEHGFGPLYLSGGEWGGDNKGVYIVDPFKPVSSASIASRLKEFGEWSTENAVVIGKNAYTDKTVAFIGDDDGGSEPDGHLGMYVGNRGDLYAGNLYVLRGKTNSDVAPVTVGDGNMKFEMGMEEGTTYDAEWVMMDERTKDELNTEAIDSSAIGFQRIEDIDWRRGSASNERTLFFNVTGNSAAPTYGTVYGRVYMVELNENDPTGDCKITCILDGDKVGGIAAGFNSPDNIVVTENYVYIQEDPNGYKPGQWAKIYQYDIANGTLKTVLECNEDDTDVKTLYGGGGKWEFTGMIDVTDIIGSSTPTFLCGVQVHGWEVDKISTAVRADGHPFYDPTAIPAENSDYEGSFLFKIEGLAR